MHQGVCSFVHQVYGPFSRRPPYEERQKSIIFKRGLFTAFAFLAMTDNFFYISPLSLSLTRSLSLGQKITVKFHSFCDDVRYHLFQIC